jgi:stage II sporulation protein R
MPGGWYAEPAEYAASRAALAEALDGGEVIRLRVIANSDSDEDQALKLRARDAVIERFGATLTAADPDTARAMVLENLANIQALVSAVVNGSADAPGGMPAMPAIPVEATFAEEYFPDREYAGMVVPANTYDSLVIRIGEAAGRNWWCVIYPPLCLMTPDTIDAAQAARPTYAAAASLGARPAAGLPTSVADLCGRGGLTRAAARIPPTPTPSPTPVFESVILRWFRSLISNI